MPPHRPTEMAPCPPSAPVRDALALRQERVDGWIEHMVSRRAVRFDSWDDLCAFVHRLLRAPDDSRE